VALGRQRYSGGCGGVAVLPFTYFTRKTRKDGYMPDVIKTLAQLIMDEIERCTLARELITISAIEDAVGRHKIGGDTRNDADAMIVLGNGYDPQELRLVKHTDRTDLFCGNKLLATYTGEHIRAIA